MKKSKGKKYALGVMAAWCLAVGAVALTGCGAKETDNKIAVESSAEILETKPIEIETRHRRPKHRRRRLQIRTSRSREQKRTA